MQPADPVHQDGAGEGPPPLGGALKATFWRQAKVGALRAAAAGCSLVGRSGGHRSPGASRGEMLLTGSGKPEGTTQC